MSALVSIIVPVYNLEDYIENCINSLTNQTYRELEIICVDDGSKDNSAAVINRLAAQDGRIKYYYQENAGVSAARNKGLDVSTGDYIMFVDGDDYLHYQAVEIFVNSIVKLNCDMISAHQKYTFKINDKMLNIDEYECNYAKYEDLFRNVNGNVAGKSSCSKLFKSNVAKSIRFIKKYYGGEDVNYIIKILNKGIRIGIVNETLYYYFQRMDSSSNSKFTEKDFSLTLSFDELCEYLKTSEYAFLKTYCLQYLFQAICIHRSRAIGTAAEDYVLSEAKRIGNKWFKAFKKNKDIDIKIRILFVLFYKSRRLYELARMIQDPTMKDYYKNRKKNRKD